MSQTIDWRGKSGATYRYWFLENPKAAGKIKAEGGNYCFAQQLANGNYLPLYFGESGDLRDRIPNHELWDRAIRLGATHVMGAHHTSRRAAHSPRSRI